MKKQVKAKTAQNELPELMAAVTKIAERLEALERKMDLVLSQTASRSFGGQAPSKPAFPQPVPPPPVYRQPAPTQRSPEVKPSQGPAHGQPQGHPQGQSHGHSHQRRERVLHKAVCADCHKDCEIPFKPTGERPVYCKECFSKRKSGNSFKGDPSTSQAPELPKVPAAVNAPQRHVSVTKKGVGKVTVSEIIRPSAREVSPKQKNPRPAKRSKR